MEDRLKKKTIATLIWKTKKCIPQRGIFLRIGSHKFN